MPWEYVGECGSGDMPKDVEWIDYCLEAGMNYLRYVLGEPPAGCELGIMMNDHELGNYPSVGVYWSFPVDEAPWEYINRAEDLLSEFDDATDWGKIHTQPEYAQNDDEDSELSESSEEVAEPPFENPSPATVNYYTYKDLQYRCKHCDWQGLGRDLELGEEFDQLVELDCPACHTKVSFVMYPSLADMSNNWDKLSDDEKMQVAKIESEQARFEALCLKSPEQLPDIDELFFTLDWDFDDEMILLRYGKKEIFKEPAVYEGYERFEEVARILKARYGNALLDMAPSQNSEVYLYGDSLTAADRIANFRKDFFGTAD